MDFKGIPGAERTNVRIGDTIVQCRVLGDEWWYDTVLIEDDATVAQFFLSLAGKTRVEARFEGDKSLVKEQEYALIYAAVAPVVETTALIIEQDAVNLFRGSFYEWKQNNTVVSEDSLMRLEGGSSYRIPTALSVLALPGDGRHDNLRRFAKPILVQGGRSIDFQITLTVDRAADYKLMIALYGLHLIPESITAAVD